MNQEPPSNNNPNNQVNPPNQSETAITEINPTEVVRFEQPVNSTPSTSTYTEKTERFKTWVELIKNIGPYIWLVVILVVIIPLIGQIFIAKAFAPNDTQKVQKHDTEVVVKMVDWTKVNESLKANLDQARNSAEKYAEKELDVWVDELMKRVDNSFLDWYFGYFNQKSIEYKSFFVQLSAGAAHLVNSNNPTPEQKVAEEITQDFQTEFANRVLRPEISQLRLERLTQETVNHYADDLKYTINNFPTKKYKISQADWDRYLNEIAITINDSEGKSSSLSLKVLVGGGGYLALKPLVAPLVLKVGSKVVAKMASKLGAKIAVKTGAVFTGKVASALLDATVGVGIIIWDLWDTKHTAAIEKPILRENIAAYLQEVKASLLNNSESGIMTVIRQIEGEIVSNLDKYVDLSN